MIDFRSMIIGIILMLRKFTCININIYEESTEDDYKLGIVMLPIIGILMGIGLFVISMFRYIYDSFFISVMSFFCYCIFTKTTNFIDVYKILNHIIKPKNESEQISSVMGVIIICSLYVILLGLVPKTAILIMPIVGYSSLIILSTIFEKNKKDTTIIKYCTNEYRFIAFLVSFFLTIIFNYKLIVPLAFTYMLCGFIVNYIDKKYEIPSFIEGFIIEIVQILFLIFTYLIKI